MKTLAILLILILGIYSTVTGSKWKKINWVKKSFVILAIILAIVLAWNSFFDLKKDDLQEKINASFGDISDLYDAKLPAVSIGLRDEGPTFFLTGTGVLNLNGWDLLKVYVKENKLFINVVVRDSKGEAIIAIYENTWKKYNDQYEFNNDDNAVELVTRGDKKVFFRVQLKKASAHLEGVIYIAPEQGLYFSDTGGEWGAGYLVIKDSVKLYDSAIIKPIFKYPREKFLGLREDYSAY